jgi:hypothetical protein
MVMPVLLPRTWALNFHRDSTFICFPHRLPIAVFALIAVSPWIRWHFSLRAALIAVGVVALVLGLLLYGGH